LFLIRHGEPFAAWGGGDPDPGLSEAGRAQAEKAVQSLAARGAAHIVSSPMRRCRETAAPFCAQIGVAAEIDVRVSEVATPPGISDRRTWLQSNFPWRGGPGRSWASLDPGLHRWRKDVLSAVATLPDQTAVFTHFIAINVIVGAALAHENTIVCRPNYASITELVSEDGALHLVSLGEEMVEGEVR
jgi:broad specificity phosphatase PhoE